MTEPKLGENRGNAGKGRPKGKPNKSTAAIKDAIIQAFEQAGGVAYLLGVAKDDPKTFCQLIGKVIPLQVEGSGIVITIARDDIKA